MMRTAMFDTRAWHVANNGVHNPWFVTRTVDGRSEYAHTRDDRVRRFKTREAAQRVADKLQVTADFNDSREYARLAVHHMIRATDGLRSDHPLLATLSRMSDVYLELTGL